LPSIGIWSGGLKVSNNAGEQFASGTDDFVESEFSFKSAWLGKDWFLRLKTEMAVIEDLSKTVYGCTRGYFKQQKAEGNDQAAQAGSLFWQLAEHHFQDLINACGIDEGMAMRPLFTHAANKAYNTYCPRDTARQLDAWAACRSQLGKYIHPKSNDSSSTNSQEKGE
jgi:CRISPR system Cascade subunit CasA